jgi:hypothetical protein
METFFKLLLELFLLLTEYCYRTYMFTTLMWIQNNAELQNVNTTLQDELQATADATKYVHQLVQIKNKKEATLTEKRQLTLS